MDHPGQVPDRVRRFIEERLSAGTIGEMSRDALMALVAEAVTLHYAAAEPPVGDAWRQAAEWPALKPRSEPPESGATGPDARELAANGASFWRRYQDERLLALGGMAEVRRMQDLLLGRSVAVKLIHEGLAKDPLAQARFVEEAQVAAQLDHPGIVPVHEVGRLPGGRLYIVMKEVKGRSLSQVLLAAHASWHRSRRALTTGTWTFFRLIDLLRKACDAVAYAHARGVIHRDLKPENVMVGQFGEVYVVDWGLTKVLLHEGAEGLGPAPAVRTARTTPGSPTTYGGMALGTPAFMSPEQAAGCADRVGPSSDVFGLGAILYYMLAGAPPFRGPDRRAALLQSARGRYEPVEAVAARSGFGPPPAGLVPIVDKALDPDPACRYADAHGLSEALDGWLGEATMRE